MTPEGYADWERIFFSPDASWPEALDHVEVITASSKALGNLSKEQLMSVDAKLKRHRIALNIEVLAQNWVGEPKCGFHVEGYSDPPGNAKVIAKLKEAGVAVASISMDEPFYFGHYYDGVNACHSPIDNIAHRVAAIVGLYLQAYPGAAVIDLEPFPAVSSHPEWQKDYRDWMQAFEAAVGRPMSGIGIDINWPDGRWKDQIASVVAFMRSQSLVTGIIYWASRKGGYGTSDEWLYGAEENFNQIEGEMGIIPDRAIFTSWSKFPDRAVSDEQGLGEDYLVKQYVERHAKAGAP